MKTLDHHVGTHAAKQPCPRCLEVGYTINPKTSKRKTCNCRAGRAVQWALNKGIPLHATRLKTNNPLDLYLATDDTPACPSCGTRPIMTDLPVGSPGAMLCECPDETCRYRYVVEPEDA